MDDAPPGYSDYDDDNFFIHEDTDRGRDPELYEGDWGESLVAHETYEPDIYRGSQGRRDTPYHQDSPRMLEWAPACAPDR